MAGEILHEAVTTYPRLELTDALEVTDVQWSHPAVFIAAGERNFIQATTRLHWLISKEMSPEAKARHGQRAKIINAIWPRCGRLEGESDYQLAINDLKMAENFLNRRQSSDLAVAARGLREQVKARRLEDMNAQINDLNNQVAVQPSRLWVNYRAGEDAHFLAPLDGFYLEESGGENQGEEPAPKADLILLNSEGERRLPPVNARPFGLFDELQQQGE